MHQERTPESCPPLGFWGLLHPTPKDSALCTPPNREANERVADAFSSCNVAGSTIIRRTLKDGVPRALRANHPVGKPLCLEVGELTDAKTKQPSVRREPSRAPSGHVAVGHTETLNACGADGRLLHREQSAMKQESHASYLSVGVSTSSERNRTRWAGPETAVRP